MSKLTQMVAPDVLTSHLQTADDYYGIAENMHPLVSEYLMKPSDMLDLFKNEGIEGLGKELKKKGDSFSSLMTKKSKGGDTDPDWESLQGNAKLVETGLGILGANPMDTIVGLKDMFGGSGLNGIQKKIDLGLK